MLPEVGARTPHFVIFAKLVAAGVRCEAEVRLPTSSHRSKSGFFRADLAVYGHGTEPVALCECKRWQRVLRGRQHENYLRSGIPYIVAGFDNVDESVAWLVAQVRGA